MGFELTTYSDKMLPDFTMSYKNRNYFCLVRTWVHHLGSPLVFGGVGVDHLFSFLYCVFSCLFVLCPTLHVSLDFLTFLRDQFLFLAM